MNLNEVEDAFIANSMFKINLVIYSICNLGLLLDFLFTDRVVFFYDLDKVINALFKSLLEYFLDWSENSSLHASLHCEVWN